MHVHSYKYYLQTLNQKDHPSKFQKFALTSIVSILILVGLTTSFIYYVYKKELPVRNNYLHLKTASSSYLATKQSLNEVLISLQVAGAKVEVVDSFREASSQATGFFTSLDDIEKIILKITSARKNVENQKFYLDQQQIPFEPLNSQLYSYYNLSSNLLENLVKDQKFLKEMTIASGPKFYLPALAKENLWEKATQEEIKIYYQDIKLEADYALASLANVSPGNFQDFYQTQLAYLDLLIRASDDIINTLSQENTKNTDEATQIEKAFELLIHANDENENLSQKLLSEKLNIYNTKNNQDQFLQVLSVQSSLDAQLANTFKSWQQPKSNSLFDFILNLKLNERISQIANLI